jgi:hypothetical protein
LWELGASSIDQPLHVILALKITKSFPTELHFSLTSPSSPPTGAQVKLDRRDLGFCDVVVTEGEEAASQNRLLDMSPTPSALR